MNMIQLTQENLAKEHICCAISSNQDCQVQAKKSWLAERLKEGLVFTKADVRGKCFIEYIPAENAWAPIEANGFMYIHCFWISGKLKGQGYANYLLNACISDSQAKGKKGLVILSAKKKMPFLSDPKFLLYKGFQVVDEAEPYYTLMYFPFEEANEKPKFKQHVKQPKINQKGFVLYYTEQCPFTAKYVPMIETIAKEKNIMFQAVHLQTVEEAQNAPAPFTSYSLFYNGGFVTNEILSEKKFEKIYGQLCEKEV